MIRVRLTLEGLSIGDAFGELLTDFAGPRRLTVDAEQMPEAPWATTGTTWSAVAVAEELARAGDADVEGIVTAMAARYRDECARPYGTLSHWVLSAVASGVPSAEAVETAADLESPIAETASRAALLGAYRYDDLDAVVERARASAGLTDPSPESAAASVAVAVAGALVARPAPPEGSVALLFGVLERVPESETRAGLERALARAKRDDPADEAPDLAPDSVALGVACAAAGASMPDALWRAVRRDALAPVAAIAGAVAALRAGPRALDATWQSRREPLPEGAGVSSGGSSSP